MFNAALTQGQLHLDGRFSARPKLQGGARGSNERAAAFHRPRRYQNPRRHLDPGVERHSGIRSGHQGAARSESPPTAIVASNDSTAGGAIQALEDNNLSGKVLVTGQDADLIAVARLYQGTQLMTVYKPIVGEARTAAEAAVMLSRHANIETRTTVPNGTQTTKAILLTPIAVTRQNAKDTVLKDGFQRIETVKQALPKDKWPELDR